MFCLNGKVKFRFQLLSACYTSLQMKSSASAIIQFIQNILYALMNAITNTYRYHHTLLQVDTFSVLSAKRNGTKRSMSMIILCTDVSKDTCWAGVTSNSEKNQARSFSCSHILQ